MSLRKEQVVLIGTLALLALLWSMGSKVDGGGSVRPGKAPALARARVPDPTLAQSRPRAPLSAPRDTFAPPRDTVPLPPLALTLPPLPRAAALAPPAWPGLAPRHFGRFLRADPTPTPAPGLFAAAEEAEGEGEAGEVAAAEPGTLIETLKAVAGTDRPLTAEERLARVEGYKKLHDWIVVGQGEPLFGQIRNPERFTLKQRPQEKLLFKEIVPETGAERFPGMPPAPYERALVTSFGLADTASNFIQQRRREFSEPITPSRYGELLEFAERCIELRLEAREALQVAEEMYRLAMTAAQEDPTPRLGLARCYAAAFDFEKVHQTYMDLLRDYPHRPEVHVALAEGEARLRLFASAEERLREAERQGGRTSWRVQWSLGNFLYDRGRYEEAHEALQNAYRNEPADPDAKDTRARIRSDLGKAQLALGKAREAADSFDKALQADAGLGLARAGRMATERLLGAARESTNGSAPEAVTTGDAPFPLLLAQALQALDRRQWEAARDRLLAAAEADPLHAFAAWRAVSWLAELTGHPDEAFRFIELAHENDPEDPWTLFQRGRLQAQRDDDAGARASFQAALDQDLDFVDALVALGELSLRNDDPQAAERYLHRAISLDATRPEVHAMRGLNLLTLNDARGAEEAFRAALALDAEQALARAGMAWVHYFAADPAKAVQTLAELDDVRRNQPETDPYRVYAKEQMARITEHETRVVFSDRFERRKLLNDWDTEEAVGPTVELLDGRLVIQGNFTQPGSTRVYRRYGAPDFVLLSLDITVQADNNARVGVFFSKERRRGAGQSEVQGMVSAARRKEGGLAVLTMDRATAEPQWEDVPPAGEPWWPTARKVRITLERVGEGTAATGVISVDGVPVREGFPLRGMMTTSNEFFVGVFVEGQTGLPAHVEVDDVQVVYKVKK